MSERLEMTFDNAAGTASKISVENPRGDLTAMEVQTAMNTMVAANVFNTTGGDLVAARSARIVTTTVNELF